MPPEAGAPAVSWQPWGRGRGHADMPGPCPGAPTLPSDSDPLSSAPAFQGSLHGVSTPPRWGTLAPVPPWDFNILLKERRVSIPRGRPPSLGSETPLTVESSVKCCRARRRSRPVPAAPQLCARSTRQTPREKRVALPRPPHQPLQASPRGASRRTDTKLRGPSAFPSWPDATVKTIQ